MSFYVLQSPECLAVAAHPVIHVLISVTAVKVHDLEIGVTAYFQIHADDVTDGPFRSVVTITAEVGVGFQDFTIKSCVLQIVPFEAKGKIQFHPVGTIGGQGHGFGFSADESVKPAGAVQADDSFGVDFADFDVFIVFRF